MLIPNDLTAILAWAFGVFLTWYTISAITTWWRLRHIPGPFLGRFSYLWHVYYIVTGGGGPVYTKLHDKYAGGGPFVRIAPNYVVTDDPDILRRIAAARSRYARDPWYTGARMHVEYDNVACILDNTEHDRMKAKVATGYSGRENGADFEPAIDSQIAALESLIQRTYLSTADELRPADISMLMKYLTLDIITRLGFGKSLGHLDEGTDVYGYISHQDANLSHLSLVLDIPFLRSIFFSPYGLAKFGPKITDKWGAGRIMGFVFLLFATRAVFCSMC